MRAVQQRLALAGEPAHQLDRRLADEVELHLGMALREAGEAARQEGAGVVVRRTQRDFARELLALGKIAIVSAEGVFPDGTPFRIPQDDDAPAPLALARRPGWLRTVF